MIKSILNNLRPEDIEFLVHNFQYSKDKRYRFGDLFPLRENATLNWHVAEGAVNDDTAADIISRGSSIDIHERQGVGRISGDIPKIGISRIMDEDDYYELRALLHQYQGNAEAVDFINLWANDYVYCYNGIMARLEWIAMQSISLGKLNATVLNNNGIVTENDVDYQLDEDQLMGVDTAYGTSGTGGHPLTVDIPNAIQAAEDRGADIGVMRMNRATWAKFIKQQEVIDMCAPYLIKLAQKPTVPTLSMVNELLASDPETYNGLRIEVIPSRIKIRKRNGERVKVNSFADNIIGFYPDGDLGRTLWVRPVEMDADDFAIKTMRELMMFQRFATTDPMVEKTNGIANAMPVWKQAPNSILMDIKNNSWNAGA